MKRFYLLLAISLLILLVTAGIYLYREHGVSKTISDREEQYGPSARSRLAPYFERAGVPYPPPAAVFVGVKNQRRLDLYAGPEPGQVRYIHSYPLLANSGHLGPKLRRGDGQIPEGLYRIESLNPNSWFHLSLRVNYPNAFDRQMAGTDGRTDLGGDIMIHGNAVSVGCLAVGDPASEELFILACDTGLEAIEVILTPVDFRTESLPSDFTPPYPWVTTLYDQIKNRLNSLPGKTEYK